MKKYFALLSALILAVSVFLPVGSLASAANTLRVGTAYDPNTFDPAELNLDSALDAAFMIYEPLLRDVGGTFGPGSAESWEASEDKTDWTFHLRESTFTDGTPVTAGDFVYALMRAMDPAAGHANAGTLLYIQGANAYYNGEGPAQDVKVWAPDDRTLRVAFVHPVFESEFTSQLYAPLKRDFTEPLGIEYGTAADKVLGSGAFTLADWAPDSSFTLAKNPAYWDADSVALDEVTFVMGAAGSDTALDVLLAGETDVSSFTSMNQISTLLDSGFDYRSITTSYRCLNLNHLGSTDEMEQFMSNVNFRRAINLAIDREQLTATVLTTDEPAFRLTAPSELGVSAPFNEEYPYQAWPTSANPEGAKAALTLALQELGKTAADVPPLVLLCFESESSVTILSAVQDMLRRNASLESTISSQTIGNMIAMAFAGEYDLWLGGNALSAPDWLPGFALGYTSESAASAPLLRGYAKPEFDALYEAAVSKSDYRERKDAQFALEKFMLEDVFSIIVSWTNTYYVFSPRVENVLFRADGSPLYTFVRFSE